MSYSLFAYQQFFNWRVLLFTITLLLIHVAVNIFNNYMDYKNASFDKYKKETNIIGRENLSLKTVRNTFLVFFVLSLITGVILTFYCDFSIFVMGVLGYYVGLAYSTGKHPINSLPVAETIPAILSGYMIPMMSAHLASFNVEPLSFSFFWQTFIAFMPMVLCMFNNLLANNTCDLEEDIKNGRTTLVYYIGKQSSLKLFKSFTVIIYLILLVTVLLGFTPKLALVLFLLVPVLSKNLKPYFAKQIKKETFPLVLKSMSLLMVGYPVIYFLGTFL